MFKNHFPNFITLTNIFFGFLSILNCYISNFTLACHFILFAAFLDLLDGKIARVFGVSTDFGKELDSLADLVSFCLAPSMLVYVLYSQNMPGISGELISATPLLLGVIRLANYNINENESSSFFIGLPTTFNAIFICSLIIYVENIKNIAPEYSEPKFLLPIVVGSSALMISRVKYPKFPLINFYSGKSNSIKLFFVISTLLLIFFSFLFNKEEIIFMLLSSVIIILGLLNHFYQSKKNKLKKI